MEPDCNAAQTRPVNGAIGGEGAPNKQRVVNVSEKCWKRRK